MISTIDLNRGDISNIEIKTDRLFDIGFRISDGVTTLVNLFLSDGLGE